MFRISQLAKAAFAASAMTIAAPALASTIVLGGSSSNGSDGNARTYSDGTTSVRVSGWAVDSDDRIEDGALGRWSSGVGVENSSTDNSHTVDNVGWRDFIVLQFSSSVVLETVQFNTGWRDDNGVRIRDTDATIGYGNLALPLSQSPNWDEVAAATAFSGFNFFESYSSGNGSQTRNVNPSAFGANTWIIGATRANIDGHKDGFKVNTITFNTPAVPEPSTWLMLLLGFGMIGGMLRADKRQARLASA